MAGVETIPPVSNQGHPIKAAVKDMIDRCAIPLMTGLVY